MRLLGAFSAECLPSNVLIQYLKPDASFPCLVGGVIDSPVVEGVVELLLLLSLVVIGGSARQESGILLLFEVAGLAEALAFIVLHGSGGVAYHL